MLHCLPWCLCTLNWGVCVQCKYALRPGFKFVDAVGQDAQEETNIQVSCTHAA